MAESDENTDGNQQKLEFFSDLKDKFILILAGIISLSTVIPAFLNSISKIFGWEHISYGYSIFVLVYFITPFLFYLAYCSIHDYVGYLELLPQNRLDALTRHKRWKLSIELIALSLVYFYLVSPGEFINKSITLCLLLIPVCTFICFVWLYRNRDEVKFIYKEFLIIGGIILTLFGFFLGGSLLGKKSCVLTNYSIESQRATFNAYDIKNDLEKNFAAVADTVRRKTFAYRMQTEVLQLHRNNKTLEFNTADLIKNYLSKITNTIDKIVLKKELKCEQLKKILKELKVEYEQLLVHDSTLVSEHDTSGIVKEIDERTDALYRYVQGVKDNKLEDITAKWTVLLKVLQFKSLCWFFFLILMGLCLWFKMQVRLKEMPNVKYSKVPLIKDNISQIKSLIFLLFVLIVPWFRQIDEKDVELTRPFLNISLDGLIKGDYQPPVYNNSYVAKDTLRQMSNTVIIDTIPRRDTIYINKFNDSKVPLDTFKVRRDPLLDVLRKDIKEVKDSIRSTKASIDRTNGNVKKLLGNPNERRDRP